MVGRQLQFTGKGVEHPLEERVDGADTEPRKIIKHVSQCPPRMFAQRNGIRVEFIHELLKIRAFAQAGRIGQCGKLVDDARGHLFGSLVGESNGKNLAMGFRLLIAVGRQRTQPVTPPFLVAEKQFEVLPGQRIRFTRPRRSLVYL